MTLKFISAISPFTASIMYFYVWYRVWSKRDRAWNSLHVSKTEDKKKRQERKGSLPRYQQFLSDEDRGTWEYQQITKTAEEMHVERRGKMVRLLIQIHSVTWIPLAPSKPQPCFGSADSHGGVLVQSQFGSWTVDFLPPNLLKELSPCIKTKNLYGPKEIS